MRSHATMLGLPHDQAGKMSGGEAQGEHTSGAGLLLSACRLHLALSSSRGADSGTAAASRPTGGAKRRRLEPEQQQQQQHQQRREDGGRSQTSGDGAVSGGVGSPPSGPFRVLLTTGKTASSSSNKEAGSKSTRIQDRRAATTAAGSGRLLSSVAMDLAHSLALRSPSLSSSSPSSSSTPLCRGCGAKNGRTSNTRTSSSSQQCQCVDVVYILYEPASSAGHSDSDDRTPGLPGGDGGDGEEEVGADLFPLRCRRVVGAAMDAHAHGTSNDNDDAETNKANQPTNSRCCSESSSPSPSSSPSWDEAALSRIQIRRMRDGADLVRYLATVPLLPPHQQPLRGIVLDDIGSFVLGNTSNGDSTGGGGGGNVSHNGGQSVAPGPSSSSSPPSLGPSYHTIDSSIVLTQILSILGNTADYLERQRRKALAASLVAQKSSNDSPATNDAPARSNSSVGDDIISHGDGLSLLVTMDGNAYSQLPPHIKPVLQNWLSTVGTLRSSSKDGEGLGKNGANIGWSLELKRDGWHLPRSSSDGPTTCSGAASCIIKQSQESADGMPEIFWSLKQ